jgi:hippurate hydrolase
MQKTLEGDWLTLATEMRGWRTALHEWPELGYEEVKTSALVAKLLHQWGYSVQKGLAGTGVLGTLSSGKPGRSVMLRADMDALPIQESIVHRHMSRRPNVMHACGHDGHTASLLGAANYISRNKPLSGTLHVLFQPAEELTNSGAARLISEGFFDQLHIDAIYGFHTWPDLRRGQGAVHRGTVMAAADFFTIEIFGQAAHAGMPHLGSDCIVAAGQVITALQTVVSRRLSPCDAGVVSIGTMRSGQVGTQVADHAVLEGTIRALTDESLEQIRLAIKQIVKNLCDAMGVSSTVQFSGAVPATVNAEKPAAVAIEALIATLEEQNVFHDLQPSMAAEDFSILLKKWPGCFFWLGAGSANESVPLHDPRFDFDDETLLLAAQVFARIVHSELSSGEEICLIAQDS